MNFAAFMTALAGLCSTYTGPAHEACQKKYHACVEDAKTAEAARVKGCRVDDSTCAPKDRKCFDEVRRKEGKCLEASGAIWVSEDDMRAKCIAK